MCRVCVSVPSGSILGPGQLKKCAQSVDMGPVMTMSDLMMKMFQAIQKTFIFKRNYVLTRRSILGSDCIDSYFDALSAH